MKGKIILTDIDKPVEGMQVVWEKALWEAHPSAKKLMEGQNWNPAIRYIKNILDDNLFRLEATKGAETTVTNIPLSELKQLAVEYWSLGDPPSCKTVLPLHPSQWNVGIALLGHEVEFKTHEDADVLPNPKRWAKLILPTPVRSINDIPEGLRQNYSADFNGNEYVEETWEDIEREYGKDHYTHQLSFFDWLKQHYSPPKRKV